MAVYSYKVAKLYDFLNNGGDYYSYEKLKEKLNETDINMLSVFLLVLERCLKENADSFNENNIDFGARLGKNINVCMLKIMRNAKDGEKHIEKAIQTFNDNLKFDSLVDFNLLTNVLNRIFCNEKILRNLYLKKYRWHHIYNIIVHFRDINYLKYLMGKNKKLLNEKDTIGNHIFISIFDKYLILGKDIEDYQNEDYFRKIITLFLENKKDSFSSRDRRKVLKAINRKTKNTNFENHPLGNKIYGFVKEVKLCFKDDIKRDFKFNLEKKGIVRTTAYYKTLGN